MGKNPTKANRVKVTNGFDIDNEYFDEETDAKEALETEPVVVWLCDECGEAFEFWQEAKECCE